MSWMTDLCQCLRGAADIRAASYKKDPPDVSNAEALRSVALGTLLFEQQIWQLRKVQSHQLQQGNYSVVRVSIDCVPQDLAGLKYNLDGDQVPLIVPVTYMKKGVLRQFDMRGPEGEPLPVIGRSEYVNLMLGVLMYQVGEALVQDADIAKLENAIRIILDDDVAIATEASRSLVELGSVEGTPLVKPDELPGFAKGLLISLAESYVLFVLMPFQYAQRRVIIKYSHHARQDLSGMSAYKRWRGALGLSRLPIAFQLSNPAGAASHHLEVSVPPALSCPMLRMPGVNIDRNTRDASDGGVVHTASSYTDDPGEPAVAEFEVPWRGTRATTCLVSATTFMILFLGIVLPGAQEALLEAADGAAALLLAVPAVAVAFAAGRRESAVESILLGPLRFCILFCAFLLLASAASVVGVLCEPLRILLWSSGSALSGMLTVALCTREGKTRLGRWWIPSVMGGVVVSVVLLLCGIWVW